ncbi:60S ribosomal protein [Polychaeton citri CBS 116435]|uniref:60S ribosomal protein n=1 Tax=Polychaeton citri CBS 116435 TaxID=1314669 RepID=A0A9P4Q8E6_9PEZI|nr:60S ribosomal protein [Polychaeton citri CBS 116435]
MAAISGAAVQYRQLAQSLPPRLLNFFQRYPGSLASGSKTQSPTTITIASNTSSSDPNEGASTTVTELAPSETNEKKNPFLAWRNPRTGNWHSPSISLRRQATLYKLAQEHGVLSLMPEGPKHPEVKLRNRIERGLRVQGTGEGNKVKGKLWERTLKGRLEQRRKAMEGMPELIRHWKQRGHGRGWKKWPK